MTMYQVDYSYKIEEYGAVTMEADSIEHAESLGYAYVRETYGDDISDIVIEGIRPLTQEEMQSNG